MVLAQPAVVLAVLAVVPVEEEGEEGQEGQEGAVVLLEEAVAVGEAGTEGLAGDPEGVEVEEVAE